MAAPLARDGHPSPLTRALLARTGGPSGACFPLASSSPARDGHQRCCGRSPVVSRRRRSRSRIHLRGRACADRHRQLLVVEAVAQIFAGARSLSDCSMGRRSQPKHVGVQPAGLSAARQLWEYADHHRRRSRWPGRRAVQRRGKVRARFISLPRVRAPRVARCRRPHSTRVSSGSRSDSISFMVGSQRVGQPDAAGRQRSRLR